MTGLVLAAGLGVVLLGLGVGFGRNRLVARREAVGRALAEIDVQLERRHLLVPRWAAVVQAGWSHERDVLTRAARAAEAGAGALARGDVAEVGSAETRLTAELREVLQLVEALPALSSHEATLRLQEDLVSTENRVAFARQHYNDTAMLYNTAVQTLPMSLVARVFRLRPADYLDLALITDAAPSTGR